jgi:DNA (cytosine-5)-methyltransferase 1
MQRSYDRGPMTASNGSVPSVVDLFCGAGGLSLGAHKAGFSTSLAVDVDHDLTSQFGVNFPDVALKHLDLAADAGKQVAAFLPDGRPDGVIGGPPCQGFSEIGRRSATDPRNLLVGSFMDVVATVQPKFFVMENVPALSWDRYSSLLARAMESLPDRYEVLEPMCLNASDYGAATSRQRLVLVGYDPECVDRIAVADFEPHQSHGLTTVRDAIADLPEPSHTGDRSLPYQKAVEPSPYAKRMRGKPPKGLGSEGAGALRKAGHVTGIEATKHSAEVVRRFRRLKQGARDDVSRYPRLRWDAPAPVLRAGTGRDRGSYQAARPIHPERPRVISVREAARIQGFPDWFQFAPTKWHSHRMIGNSVSPVFAHQLLAVVRSRLGED